MLCHAPSCCHAFGAQSKMNAARRNVFTEGQFFPSAARLDFKLGTWRQSFRVVSQHKLSTPHRTQGLVTPSLSATGVPPDFT